MSKDILEEFKVTLELNIVAKSEKEVFELLWKILNNDTVACTKVTVKEKEEN